MHHRLHKFTCILQKSSRTLQTHEHFTKIKVFAKVYKKNKRTCTISIQAYKCCTSFTTHHTSSHTCEPRCSLQMDPWPEVQGEPEDIFPGRPGGHRGPPHPCEHTVDHSILVVGDRGGQGHKGLWPSKPSQGDVAVYYISALMCARGAMRRGRSGNQHTRSVCQT